MIGAHHADTQMETAVYVRKVLTSLINSQVYCSTEQHSRRIEGNLITSRFNTNGEIKTLLIIGKISARSDKNF